MAEQDDNTAKFTSMGFNTSYREAIQEHISLYFDGNFDGLVEKLAKFPIESYSDYIALGKLKSIAEPQSIVTLDHYIRTANEEAEIIYEHANRSDLTDDTVYAWEMVLKMLDFSV